MSTRTGSGPTVDPLMKVTIANAKEKKLDEEDTDVGRRTGIELAPILLLSERREPCL
jgi:hypothetical protein